MLNSIKAYILIVLFQTYSNILNFQFQGLWKAVISRKIYAPESTVWHHAMPLPWKEIDDQVWYYKYIRHKDL